MHGLLSLHELERRYRLDPISLAAKKAAAEVKSILRAPLAQLSRRRFKRHTVPDRFQTANQPLRFDLR